MYRIKTLLIVSVLLLIMQSIALPNNESDLLKLAKKKFGTLTNADIKLFKAVANGETADYTIKLLKDNNLTVTIIWNNDNKIKSDRINWLCIDNNASKLVNNKGILILGAYIEGEISLQSCTISFPLCFEKCFIPYKINLNSSKINSLSLSGCNTGMIDGTFMSSTFGLYLNNHFETNQPISFKGAFINGDINCSESTFLGEFSKASSEDILLLDGINVLGSISFEKSIVKGSLRIVGASVQGDLVFSGSHLINTKSYALTLDTTFVKGSIFLNNNFISEGTVGLGGAEIGGMLICDSGNFRCNKEYSYSIIANHIKVRADASFQNGFNSNGMINMVMANIGGDIKFSNGKCLNSGSTSLITNGSYIKGNFIFDNGFKSEGMIELSASLIEGCLKCENCQFLNKGKNALYAPRLKVKNDIYISNNFYSEGGLIFYSATVDGNFLYNEFKYSPNIILDIRSAKIGRIFDNPNSWPQKGNLGIDGLVYDDIYSTSTLPRINWVRLQPTKDYSTQPPTKVFHSQPYEQLANVLQKNGNYSDANMVLFEKEKDRAKFAEIDFWKKLLWYYSFGKLIGYGYYPLKILKWILLMISLGTILFWKGYNSKKVLIIPLQNYPVPKFSPLIYSIETFMPIINLRMANFWIINAESFYGKFLRFYLCIHIITGWIFTILLVGALSGLIRT